MVTKKQSIKRETLGESRRHSVRRGTPVEALKGHTSADQLREFPEAAEIIKQGAASVLADVRKGLSTLALEHRKSLYREVTRAYAVGLVLKADKDEWLNFCLHNDWANFRDKPKDSDRSDALRYAIRFAVGFAKDRVAKKAKDRRVNRLYGALKSFFVEGVSPAEITTKIRESGGLEKLKSANAETAGSAIPPKQAYATFRVPLEGMHRLFLARETPFKMTVNLQVQKIIGNRVDAQLVSWKATRRSTDLIPTNPCNTSFAPQMPSNAGEAANDDGSQLKTPTKAKHAESTVTHRKVVNPQ
ncbi:MAG: hypothetical protein EOR01_23675 [Mesorhizobium sp.]|uniref:hypothetical protein n=1 Tax=Mesorhizobium sp. TaxID=1871066 RepID=UPI000FE60553|nr:hypothetical protein [Mesorhizobium sp.]RWP18022.1 MAG: hypothetical protein EOR01_23675 [Mesorhizobium sp.]